MYQQNMKSTLLSIICAFIVMPWLATSALAAPNFTYSVTDIGVNPFPGIRANTNPQDLNNVGEIVGSNFSVGSDNSLAFLYRDEKITDLGRLEGFTYSVSANGINDEGVVVGISSTYPASSGRARGFIFEDGMSTELDILGGYRTEPRDINNLGQIVGAYQPENSGYWKAFFYEEDRAVDLGFPVNTDSIASAINNVGQITGYVSGPGFQNRAFIHSRNVVTYIGNLGGSVLPSDISDNGSIVGSAEVNGEAVYHAFIYDEGEIMDLGTFGGAHSGAYGINSHGDVVGFSQAPGNKARGFIYREGVMTDLNDLIDPELHFTVFGGRAINDRGQIAAYGKYGGHDSAGPVLTVLLTPVPEPSSFILLTFIIAEPAALPRILRREPPLACPAMSPWDRFVN